MRLEKKVALITGAGSGIGEATALLFAREGASVLACDLALEPVERLANVIKTAGGSALAVGGDVSTRADAERMVAEAIGTFGRIDILVNSAGVTPRAAPLGADFEEVWDWVINVNLKGTYLMCWFAVKAMKESGGGSIVNLSSIIGLVGYHQAMGGTGFNPYPHSKGGVLQMTRDMGVALARERIRVNCLCPGFTKTNLTKRLTEDRDMLARLESLHPMGRLGEPEEIARAALFLASDEASFITGAALAVDGGYTAQ